MNVEKTIIENKGKIKINELRMKALIKVLSKEGIVTKEEVEEELNELLEGGNDEK